MKKIITICMLLAMSWLTAEEVALPKTTARREGFGGFGVGVYNRNMDELNKRLTANGYGKIESNFTTVSGGGYGYVGDKFLMGGSGFGGIPNQSESDSAKAEISEGGGFFEMGYIAYEDKSFRIWPMIGIGGMGTNISITPKSTTPSFDEVLKNPKRTADLMEGNLALKLALNADLVFQVNVEEKKNSTIAGSLQLGMIYQAGSSLWVSGEDLKVSKGPSMPRERFFVGLNIYFGGSEKNN